MPFQNMADGDAERRPRKLDKGNHARSIQRVASDVKFIATLHRCGETRYVDAVWLKKFESVLV